MWILTKLVIAFLVTVCIVGAMTRPYISAHGFQRVALFHSGTQRAMMIGGLSVLLVALVFWKNPQKPD